MYKRPKTYIAYKRQIGLLIKNILNTISYMYWKNCAKVKLEDIRTINFLCSGNICRSPFAESLTRMYLRDSACGIKFTSSGLFVKQNERSPNNAIRAAKNFGIDLSNHTPRPISQMLIDKSSIIIGMHYQHYRIFRKRFPNDEHKFILLKHIGWPKCVLFNINDPFDLPIAEFIACFSEIDLFVRALSYKLLNGKEQ